MTKQWQCICKEWVDVKYPAHTHASAKQWFDGLKSHKTIGQPPEIWTYEREPDRPVRDDEQGASWISGRKI